MATTTKKAGRPRRPLSQRKNQPGPNVPRLVRCSCCGERKHQSNFYYKAGSGQLLHYVCRPCLNERRATKRAKRQEAQKSAAEATAKRLAERRERVSRVLNEHVVDEGGKRKRILVVAPKAPETNGHAAGVQVPLGRLLDIAEPVNVRALRRLVNKHPVDYLTLLAEELAPAE